MNEDELEQEILPAVVAVEVFRYASDGTFISEGTTRVNLHEAHKTHEQALDERLAPVRHRILWHIGCEQRHGVMKHVTKSEWPLVAEMLMHDYGVGQKHGLWAQAVVPGQMWDLEFCSQRTWERTEFPWSLCGDTFLFADWQQRATYRLALRRSLHTGDHVQFQHKGVTYHGLVTRVNKVTVEVLVGASRWKCSPELLEPWVE